MRIVYRQSRFNTKKQEVQRGHTRLISSVPTLVPDEFATQATLVASTSQNIGCTFSVQPWWESFTAGIKIRIKTWRAVGTATLDKCAISHFTGWVSNARESLPAPFLHQPKRRNKGFDVFRNILSLNLPTALCASAIERLEDCSFDISPSITQNASGLAEQACETHLYVYTATLSPENFSDYSSLSDRI